MFTRIVINILEYQRKHHTIVVLKSFVLRILIEIYLLSHNENIQPRIILRTTLHSNVVSRFNTIMMKIKVNICHPHNMYIDKDFIKYIWLMISMNANISGCVIYTVWSSGDKTNNLYERYCPLYGNAVQIYLHRHM